MKLLRRSPRLAFAPDALRVLSAARSEAAALGHDYLGTEHVLIALADDESVARVLEDVGLSGDELRREVRASVGGCRSGRRPDPDALAAIGIDLDEVRRRADETFGPGALDRTRAGRRPLRRTTRLKKAIVFAARDAGCDGTPVSPKHLLLALASCDGLAAEILAARGLSAFDVATGTREG